MDTRVTNTLTTAVGSARFDAMLHILPFDSYELVHVITEFSFGPYFPDMTQPLDYSFEVTDERTS